MAKIKKIMFNQAGKKEGCLCDKCGQYITNIYTVSYSDDVAFHYGVDCFDRLCKENRLNAYGMKLMRQASRDLARYQKELDDYVNGKMNAENDGGWKFFQSSGQQGAWHGADYEEYRRWMIEVWYPARFADVQKKIDKFSKIDFKR